MEEGEPTLDNGFIRHVVAENDVMHDEAMEDAMEEDLEGVLGAVAGGDHESLAKDVANAGDSTNEIEKSSVLMDDAPVTGEERQLAHGKWFRLGKDGPPDDDVVRAERAAIESNER